MLILWTRQWSLQGSTEIKMFPSHDTEVICSESFPEVGKKDTLLVMGGPNLNVVQAAGYLPKNRTVTSLREKLYKLPNGSDMMVTFDINIKEFDYANYVRMQTDLSLVKRFIDTGSLDPQFGDYSWVKGYEHLPDAINDMYNITGKPVPVALDLETVGLFPWFPEKFIVSISFSIEEGSSDLVRFKGIKDQPSRTGKRWQLWDQIQWLLNDDRISLVGANLKFDLIWIRVKWGIECTNFRFDTTLVGSLLDENRSNSLNTHCKIYAPTLGGYDDVFNSKVDKSRMDLVPDKVLLPYAGGDTDATLRVALAQADVLAQSKRQVNFYIKLLHPASRAFEDMEYTGVLLDTDYYQQLEDELNEVMDKLTKSAKKLMPARILNKYPDDEFRLSRPAIIKDFMFTHPKGLKLKPLKKTAKNSDPSTAHEHLIMFEKVPEAKEFIGILKEWNSASKTLSTYVIGFLKHLRPDARLHPTAVLYKGDYGDSDSGTVTGRLAFKNPASQTIPKHTKWAKKLRKGYIAPKEYCVVNFDYSQGELRVIACVSHCKPMINAYKQGLDLHLKTGAELNGYSIAQAIKMKESKDPLIKKIRQGGKAGNFGLIYGISPEGYVEYALNTYGVVLTLKEAKHQHSAFFEMYPELVDYHNEYKEFANKKGWVQSPLGRVRHLPLIRSSNYKERGTAERQAINSPIQSTLSDLSQLALSEFKRKHGYHDDCKFFMMTHDSLTAYVKKDQVNLWVPEVQGIMENLPIEEHFGWKPELKFLTDWEIGLNMADMLESGDHPNIKPSELLKLAA